MGGNIKSLTEVGLDNIHSSSFVYQASHLVTEVYLLGHVWLTLGECLLTSHDSLVIYVPGNGLQQACPTHGLPSTAYNVTSPCCAAIMGAALPHQVAEPSTGHTLITHQQPKHQYAVNTVLAETRQGKGAVQCSVKLWQINLCIG